MSPFFSSAPFHENLQAIFAKHCMTTRHQHHIAWLGQTNDTEALLKTEISKLVEVFADLGFLVWIWQKRGVDFYKLNVYLLKSSKISKICWFILNGKFQSSSFIQSYPPKKKKKLVLIPMLYLVTWVTWATQPLGSSPSTVKVSFQVSRLPLHREKHRPHYFKLGSLHSGSNPNTLWTKPGNHRNTFTKHSLFCQENFIEYHLVKVLEGCSHSWDSKCSQHVTYYSKTWYFFTIPDCVIRHQKNSALKPSQASLWSVKLPHAVQGIQFVCQLTWGFKLAPAHRIMPRQLLHHFQRQNPGICPHVPRRECSANRWPEGFWNAWVNPTMVTYMTYVINIYIYIFQYYIYTGIIHQCPVVLILNPKNQKFPRVNQKFFRPWIKKSDDRLLLGIAWD